MGDLLARRAWWVVGAMALVLGLFASAGPGLDAAKDGSDWLGQHTVALIALASILVGILAFTIGRISTSWGMRPGHFEADKETFTDLTDALPREVVDFLKEHDFGNSWRGNHTEPLYTYVMTRNAVEHRFHDKAIERKRAQLHRDCEAFIQTLASYSIPNGHGDFFELNEKEWVRSHPPNDENYKRYEAHRRDLGDLADAVVAAYDDLVAIARQRLPGA